MDLGSIVHLLHYYCSPSLGEWLLIAFTVTHIGMMREGTTRNFFASTLTRGSLKVKQVCKALIPLISVNFCDARSL